ncbi:hypothetical protein DSO57_1029992 [Entomophthora muscae]|uniref:Uncharacterized protein n=1 Tax=Entomophthora muscae TaxID=34485 RepID=A0ACC2RFT8_9FUNG|nr:hypothetical protein DSO57_1029992 [Entomophthora muscae]
MESGQVSLLKQNYIGTVSLDMPVQLGPGVFWNDGYWSTRRNPNYLVSKSGTVPSSFCIKGTKKCLNLKDKYLWIDFPSRISEVTFCGFDFECFIRSKLPLNKTWSMISTLEMGKDDWGSF